MKWLVLLLSVVWSIQAAPETYILGGESARRDDKPFVVSVQYRVAPNYVHVCGGVVISREWILTAGSCKQDIPIEVVSGKYDLMVFEEGQQRRGILVRSSVMSTDGRVALVSKYFMFRCSFQTSIQKNFSSI